MSFHEITGIPPNMPISAEQFPVFLFPDITGDCLGLLQLAHQLQIARGNKSPIYIWHDPKTSEAGQSLDTYAEKIKNEIIKLLPVGPCYLGGYSFGGGLGSVVAQKLGEAKRKASLFVIDTPSIEGSQAYLQPQNAAATQDLVAIFNYAASLACHYTGQKMENPALSEESFLALCKLPLAEQLASLKDLYIQAALQAETTESETKVAAVLQTKSSAEQLQLLRAQVKTINAEELLALAQKTPVEQLAFLKTALIKQNKDDKLSGLLTQYAAVATQNLLSLLKHQDQRTYPPLAKISLFLSHESQKKYNFNVANSWATYCHAGELGLPEADSTHLSLIKNKANCKAIAEKMSGFFKGYFSTKDIMTMLMLPWVTNNPDLDLYEFAQELEKSKAVQSKQTSPDEDQAEIVIDPPSLLRPTHASPSLALMNPAHTQAQQQRQLSSRSHSSAATLSPHSPFDLSASYSPPLAPTTTLQASTLSPPLHSAAKQSASSLPNSPNVSPSLLGLTSSGSGLNIPSLKLDDMEDTRMVLSPKGRRKKSSVLPQPSSLQQPATFFALHPTRTTRNQERRQEAALLLGNMQQQPPKF